MPATNAQEFYRSAYSRSVNPSKLDDAFRWLNKAIQFESEEANTKTEMALKQALKCEVEGLN